MAKRSKRAEKVCDWFREHLREGGPKLPYTEAEAEAIRAEIKKLRGEEQTVAVTYYERKGFSVGVERVPVPFKFSMDAAGAKVWEGYTYGGTWNGWAEPLVTTTTLRRLAKDMDCPENRWEFDGDVLTVTCEGSDPIKVEAEVVKIRDSKGRLQQVALYDVSLGFCWVEED